MADDPQTMHRIAGRLRRLAAGASPLRVAIAGHRWNQLDRIDGERLAALLPRLFALLDRAARRRGVLICGMAEGVDLIAATACPHQWRLAPVLALPPEAWRRHLAALHAPSVALFDRAMRDAHSEAPVVVSRDMPDFDAVAARILADADLLIAVWNGAPGLPGGTASVVDAADMAGIPVLVVPVPMIGRCRLIGENAP
ncbi:MAG: hypothetical protein AAF899_06370 [Pseudomonadota bacterium]